MGWCKDMFLSLHLYLTLSKYRPLCLVIIHVFPKGSQSFHKIVNISLQKQTPACTLGIANTTLGLVWDVSLIKCFVSPAVWNLHANTTVICMKPFHCHAVAFMENTFFLHLLTYRGTSVFLKATKWFGSLNYILKKKAGEDAAYLSLKPNLTCLYVALQTSATGESSRTPCFILYFQWRWFKASQPGEQCCRWSGLQRAYRMQFVCAVSHA